MFANEVSRWTAEGLTALQEVRPIILQKSIMDIVLIILVNKFLHAWH